MAYKWVQSSAYSSIPPNAIVGGNDEDGAMIYVGRAQHEGDMLVCKVVPSKQIGYVSYRGEALPKDIFEVLCGQNLVWVKCYNHVIPESAVLCGRTAQLDQPVYIGRGNYDGHLIIGRISSVHRALFIPFRGAERRLESYDILVEEKRVIPGWQLSSLTETKLEKCPPTPPLPSPPPALEPEKPFRYPLNMSAMPFPMQDRPPKYTPKAPPQPILSPTVLASASVAVDTSTPLVSSVPPLVPPYNPPTYDASAFMAPASVVAASVTPAATYQPSVSCSYAQSATYGYTPAETLSYGPAQSYAVPAAVVIPATQECDIWMEVSGNCGYVPPDAVIAGHDSDMSPLFVCRAFCNGLKVPGKAAPSRGCAYIAYAGREIVETYYEVLIGQNKYHWVPGCSGSIARGAVEAGRTENGEPLYVGRAQYCGSLTPGKIHQSHQCLYIPFGGTERRIVNYEVLVRSEFFYCQQFMP